MLQEANYLLLEGRISQYAGYYGHPIHPSDRSRASLVHYVHYVHVKTGGSKVDRSDLSTSNADYVAVTVNIFHFKTTAVSAYIWPKLRRIRMTFALFVLVV